MKNILNKIIKYLDDILLIVGISFIVLGVFYICKQLGFIALGAGLIFLSYIAAKGVDKS